VLAVRRSRRGVTDKCVGGGGGGVSRHNVLMYARRQMADRLAAALALVLATDRPPGPHTR